MNYYIARGFDLDELTDMVNELLSDGWELRGGVSVSLSESDDFRYSEYCQAVVRSKRLLPAKVFEHGNDIDHKRPFLSK